MPRTQKDRLGAPPQKRRGKKFSSEARGKCGKTVCVMFPFLDDPDFPFLFSFFILGPRLVVIFRRTEKIVVWGTLVGGGGETRSRTEERKTNSFLPPPLSLPFFFFSRIYFRVFFYGRGNDGTAALFSRSTFSFSSCVALHPARALSKCQRGGFSFSALKKLNFNLRRGEISTSIFFPLSSPCVDFMDIFGANSCFLLLRHISSKPYPTPPPTLPRIEGGSPVAAKKEEGIFYNVSVWILGSASGPPSLPQSEYIKAETGFLRQIRQSHIHIQN